MRFEEIDDLMLFEYDSDARQIQAKGKLYTLRLRIFMQEKDVSTVSVVFFNKVSYIDKLAPQCHSEFRSDDHKINYLRKAAAEHKEWSAISIQRITSGKLSFNVIVAALWDSIQILKGMEQIIGTSDNLEIR